MPRYTYRCEECEEVFKEFVKMKFYRDPQDCPNCGGDKTGKRIIDGCPATRVGGEGSDRQIELMQASFRQKYMKEGIDDTKHKFGEKEVNQSLIGAELSRRISEKKGD